MLSMRVALTYPECASSNRGRAPRGWATAAVLLAVLGILVGFAALQQRGAYVCPGVGLATQTSGTDPDRALRAFIEEQGGNPSAWKRAGASDRKLAVVPRSPRRANQRPD